VRWSRWGGGQPSAEVVGKIELLKREEGILIKLLGEVVHVFVDLMADLGLPGLPELRDLPGWCCSCIRYNVHNRMPP